MKNLLKNLFNIQFDHIYTKYKFLNFSIKLNRGKQSITLSDLRTYTLAASLHKNLGKYRGIYEGREIAIIGGGPSVKDYKDIKDSIKIGINRAYMLEQIKFDYLFAQDNFALKSEVEEFINYRPDDCVKFFGLHGNVPNFRIRPSTIARTKNREFYVLNNNRPKHSLLPIDITAEPFARFCGTVFAALQFALFTNPKRIYLVGFDCSKGVHAFDTKPSECDFSEQYKYWLQFKNYKEQFWEDIEIVSINPVNLKGLFKDIYTN